MSKDDIFWVNSAYVVLAVVAGYVGYRAIETLGVQFGWADKFDAWYPLMNNLAALVIGAASAWWVRADKERLEYHVAAVNEVRKVTWPSGPDTKRMTIVVVVVVAIFAVILAFFDLCWSYALKGIVG